MASVPSCCDGQSAGGGQSVLGTALGWGVLAF